MKSVRHILCCLVLSQLPAVAGVPSEDQTRLVRLELELGLYKASGLGENHPRVRRLENGIRLIENRDPDVRDETYGKLMHANRMRLEDERDRLIDGGYGEKHPQRLEIERQLMETERRLESLKK